VKNVIVCAQYSSAEPEKWKSFLQDAKVGTELPQGVRKVFYMSWIVDVHSNAKFLAGLVHSAHSHDVPLVAFELAAEQAVVQVGDY